MKQEILNDIYELRKALHAVPELAFHEEKTKRLLMTYLQENTGLEAVDRGSWFYAFYPGSGNEACRTSDSAAEPQNAGQPAIALRADFDAVEGTDGVPGHYCGHDGHSAILAGFGRLLCEIKPSRPVYLLFQPAEETGQGAAVCCQLLKEKNIGEIYGFHNFPGFEENSVLVSDGTFACASTGLEITFTGTPAHAAYPEAGKNPADAAAKLVLARNRLLEGYSGLVLATVIGVDLGSDAYGVSASKGIVKFTLRAEREKDYQRLVASFENEAAALAGEYGLQVRTRRIEEFPASENHAECAEKVRKAALAAGKKVLRPAEVFRASEDFGLYMQLIPGALFGIGDGEKYPPLHTAGYSFPDNIAETALEMWSGLVI